VHTQKVLVVDDDPHIREVLRFALEKAGFDISTAEDGQQALNCFADQQPDLVVLDIMMPEMDGTDVCRTLRRHSTVPIVFLSSRDDEVDRIIGLELGGDDYVTKPFSPRELVARVRAVLRRTDSQAEAQTDSDAATRSTSSSLDERKTIGTVLCWRNVRHTSVPSISGIIMSKTTKSGC